MIGALWNGITGLNSFEKALNVESNNATNVNTVGYKEDIINFADLMYENNMSNLYGKGSSVASVSKAMYQQGGIKITSNPYDVAIEGKGYFIVENLNSKGERETFYTRAGNFQIGEDGVLQSQNNMNVLGLVSSKTQDSTSGDIKFNNNYTNFVASQNIGNINNIVTINAKATNYNNSAISDNSLLSGNNYKTKSSKINDVDALISDYKEKLKTYSLNSMEESNDSISQETNINLSSFLTSTQNENSVIKLSIDGNQISQLFIPSIAGQEFKENLYSSLTPSEQLIYGDPSGVLTTEQREKYNLEFSKQETLNAFSDKISKIKGLSSTINSDTGILEINSLIPGEKIKINEAYINQENIDNQIIITQEGQLGSGLGMVNSSKDALKTALNRAGAEFLEITNTVSLENEKSNSFENISKIQLNLSALDISDSSIGNMEIIDGIVYVKEGDNKFIVGKLQTATFVNEQGLVSQGDNLYQNSKEAGKISNAVNLNKLVSSSLEQSKANLGNSLTALLIYQKAFEANSKSITTSDEMLQTAIQLKK